MNFSTKVRHRTQTILPVAVLFAAFMCINSCSNEKKQPDVSQVDVTLKADRLEFDLAAHTDDVSFLYNKYGSFFDLFIYKIVPMGTSDTTLLKSRLKDFVNDADIKNIYSDVRRLYSDFKLEDGQLTDAFRHYKYFFPGKIIPKVVTLISGFNYGIVAVDSVLGIGLDMYLGDSSRYYPSLQFPTYKIRKLRKEYIAADAMRSWLQTEWEEDVNQTDLLSSMIHQGKILYALNAMMPSSPDSIKTGYTAKQLKWCEDNEKNTWSFFVEHNLLFASDPGQVSKFVAEGPTTNGFPKESPGNIGMWIGWRIVSSYMNEFPKTTLLQLVNNYDYKKIFQDSKYKPRK
jgi:hypothetical protein